MKHCNWIARVERYFDGEDKDAAAVKSHLKSCRECSGHYACLEVIRGSLKTGSERPVIADAQFSAFMDGIRKEIAVVPRSGHRGFWAFASLAAAALVVALATFSMFTGPRPVGAAEVESVSTDLEGATVGVYSSEEVTTVYINYTGGDDLW